MPKQRKSAENDTAGLDVEKIIDAATAHGEESVPEHEVGDLQQALREAWKHLTPEGRRAVMEDWTTQETLSWLGPL